MAPGGGRYKRRASTSKAASAAGTKKSKIKEGRSKQFDGESEKVEEEEVRIRERGSEKGKENKSGKTSFQVVVRGSSAASGSNGGIPSNIEVDGSGNVSMETSDNPSREWFEKCRKNGLMTNDNWMTLDLDRYVRVDLFPTLKFFMDKKQLNFTTVETSICWQICTEMELKKDKAEAWWEESSRS